MSQFTGEKLTEEEAAALKANGINTQQAERSLDPDNSRLARIVGILCSFHPPNPLFNIPVLDAAGLCRLYEVDFFESLEAIAAVFSGMNKAISEKMRDAGTANVPVPWRQ